MTGHVSDRCRPNPWELRADLVRRVTADLHGPLDGEQRGDPRLPARGRDVVVARAGP